MPAPARPRAVAAGLALALLAAVPGAAQNTRKGADPASGLLQASEPARLADLVLDAGYRAVLDKTDRGTPVIDSAAEGANFSIYFLECEDGTDCWSIQFVSSFTLDGPADLAVLNDWNRRRTIGQASTPEANVAQIAHYMTLRHGVSDQNFLYMFDQWRIALRDFMVHVGFRR